MIDFWNYFFENGLYISYFSEFIAIVAGFYYLIKVKNPPYGYSYFVFYLFIILGVEIIALYPLIAHFTKYEYFGFTEHSVFKRNFWLYNSFLLVMVVVLLNFFKTQIHSARLKRFIQLYLYLYVPASILAVLSFDNFFYAHSNFIYMGSCAGVLMSVALYLLELINSDRILKFHLYLSFYVAVLLLLWNITITPLFIYSEFITSENPEFTKLYYNIIRYANLILYLGFAFGFYIDYKSSVRNIENY